MISLYFFTKRVDRADGSKTRTKIAVCNRNFPQRMHQHPLLHCQPNFELQQTSDQLLDMVEHDINVSSRLIWLMMSKT